MQRFSLKSALAISASAAMLTGAMTTASYAQTSDGFNPEDEVVSRKTRPMTFKTCFAQRFRPIT